MGIKWEGDKAEPGLVKAKEAYQKIPMMCLKFYEKHLVWNKVAKPASEDKADNNSQQPSAEVKPAETEAKGEVTKEEAAPGKDDEQSPSTEVKEKSPVPAATVTATE